MKLELTKEQALLLEGLLNFACERTSTALDKSWTEFADLRTNLGLEMVCHGVKQKDRNGAIDRVLKLLYLKAI